MAIADKHNIPWHDASGCLPCPPLRRSHKPILSEDCSAHLAAVSGPHRLEPLFSARHLRADPIVEKGGIEIDITALNGIRAKVLEVLGQHSAIQSRSVSRGRDHHGVFFAKGVIDLSATDRFRMPFTAFEVTDAQPMKKQDDR